MTLFEYVLIAMLFMSPLHKNANIENPNKRLTRYQSIAIDIAHVASTEKPYFKGPFAKEKTAILITSIAKHESNFDEAVDNGTKRGALGDTCIMQVMPNMVDTKFYYTAEYLLSDRKNCLKAGLKIARETKCPGGIGSQLRSYVSGRCSTHPDKEKEKRISTFAYGEVHKYILFTRKHGPHLYFKK